MQVNTLTLYLLAEGVSINLSLVLTAFANFQPGTRLNKSCAVAILMLSVGFALSDFGPELPRWMKAIVTYKPLILAAAMLHAAFIACSRQQPVIVDWLSWGIVAMTALPFWC